MNPSWFTEVVARPSRTFSCRSRGARVRYRGWDTESRDKPGLLFVHGFLAHGRWWDFVAPYFSEAFRVFAIDLSGMGDSAHRRRYGLDIFAHDIVSVIDHARIAPAILVGHSFGGARVLQVCADYPQRVARAIVLDSVIAMDGVGAADGAVDAPAMRIGNRTYPDQAEILSRYRLTPEQPAEPYLRDYVARHSIRAVDSGWCWKFDPALRLIQNEALGPDVLSRIRVPLHYVSGELSRVVPPRVAAAIGAALPKPNGHGPLILPGTHHHLMLDQPRLLTRTLQDILS